MIENKNVKLTKMLKTVGQIKLNRCIYGVINKK